MFILLSFIFNYININSTDINTSKDEEVNIVQQILDKDSILIAQIESKHLLSNEIFGIFEKRVKLYEEVLKNPSIDILEKTFLESRKSNLFTELNLFKFKIENEKQLNHLYTRIEELEEQVKAMMKQQIK